MAFNLKDGLLNFHILHNIVEGFRPVTKLLMLSARTLLTVRFLQVFLCAYPVSNGMVQIDQVNIIHLQALQYLINSLHGDAHALFAGP